MAKTIFVYKVVLTRFPSGKSEREESDVFRQRLLSGGASEDEAKKLSALNQKVIAGLSNGSICKGDVCLEADSNGYYLKTFLPRIGYDTKPLYVEEVLANGVAMRTSNDLVVVDTREMPSGLQYASDILSLSGHIPNERLASHSNGRYLFESYPGCMEYVTTRVHGKEASWTCDSTISAESRTLGTVSYTGAGSRDGNTPNVGYKLRISRKDGKGQRTESLECLLVERRQEEGKVDFSRISTLRKGVTVIDKRLGEFEQRSYLWSGSLPTDRELKAMKRPSQPVQQAHAVSVAVMAFGLVVVGCAVIGMSKMKRS